MAARKPKRAGISERLYALAAAKNLVRPRGRNPHSLVASEIAEATGLGESHISRLFNGELGKEPQYKIVVVLASFFGVRSEWLFAGEGPQEEISADALLDFIKKAPKGMLEAVESHPGQWRASTIVEALNPENLRARTVEGGGPKGGWKAALDDIQGRHRQLVERDADRVDSIVEKQAGPRRKLSK